MISTMITAFVSFASTNIDNIFVLIIFYSQVGDQLKKSHIIIGQYIGISILIIISVLGSYGLKLVPQQYTGLLGMVPIVLGIKAWLESRKEKEPDANSTQAILETQTEAGSDIIEKNHNDVPHDSNIEIEAQASEQSTIKAVLGKFINPAILNVSLVTLANGGDNISIYIPLFTTLNTFELIATLVIFLLLIAVWCFIGEKLTNFPGIKHTIQKYKNIILPVVYIGIGILILSKVMYSVS